LVSRYLNDILCKNYNYTFVFAKVIPKTLLVPFFSGHGVISMKDCQFAAAAAIPDYRRYLQVLEAANNASICCQLLEVLCGLRWSSLASLHGIHVCNI